jgi:hypothetical protein
METKLELPFRQSGEINLYVHDKDYLIFFKF